MQKTTTKVSTKKKGGGRHPKPENLPIKRRLIDLPEEQKVGLIKIREEITEQIEFRPSQFYRLHLVRPVYAHPKKEHAPILAALPPQVIRRPGVGPGFIAHILVAKYATACPCTDRRESMPEPACGSRARPVAATSMPPRTC